MKLKTIFGSILTCGLVAVSASAQSSLVDSASSAKARTAGTDLASVKLVSSVTTNGKEILILPSGQKVPATLAQKPAKAPGTFALSKVATKTFALSKVATKVKAAKAGSVLSSAVIVSSDARMGLAPGQIVVIGKTGGAKTSTTPITLADVVVVAPAAPASVGLSANPLAATIERQVFAGDLPRDTAAPGGLALGTVAGATGATAIGPNGFPVFTGTAAPQSGTNPIGPNGFPQPLTNGPQAGIQPVGPDGFPVATVPPFTQSGTTRAGTPRDASVPVTAPATAAGVSRSAVAAPATGLTVGVGAPAISTSGAAATTTSPQ
jgi:hypothetical protein